ncbi:hypothetical protein B0S90_0231 [Caldicellulosiruptor bescii]|uniref:Uncharacterized protein n=2 Tax=Caldicellulosiruptor bescii TaxID=31899 RepID=B9MQD4_CALBD|nr:hypothetical protein [Caldicellulosiruptor bescii]ACM61791.1 conserved hypothetical protein [Caldicellulosiruptor bescii DSM 6725]PBC88410.1 hypothetical protein B0S87_1394 [Caldicellulosiruptor bescii]PBC92109.1 hypothetical protein B0S89_2599 [Caldicellulosiruptor bescii]PBD05081.1 hypothetical protein B0S85_2807 [Caldicellulosiruptor bescii]PBD05288.1 hypothetical protein B0S90_0231 [Caldicellulosiruptor bescii]
MGFVSFEIKEFVDILLKNVDIPEIITNVEVDKNEVKVNVKPAAFLPQMSLRFTIESDQNKFLILFDPSKSLIIYGFLLGKFKDGKIEGIKLLKDRLEIDLQKVLTGNLKGVKIDRIDVGSDGKIEINFCCHQK